MPCCGCGLVRAALPSVRCDVHSGPRRAGAGNSGWELGAAPPAETFDSSSEQRENFQKTFGGAAPVLSVSSPCGISGHSIAIARQGTSPASRNARCQASPTMRTTFVLAAVVAAAALAASPAACADLTAEQTQEVYDAIESLVNDPTGPGKAPIVSTPVSASEAIVEGAAITPVVLMHGLGDSGSNPGMQVRPCARSAHSIWSFCGTSHRPTLCADPSHCAYPTPTTPPATVPRNFHHEQVPRLVCHGRGRRRRHVVVLPIHAAAGRRIRQGRQG